MEMEVICISSDDDESDSQKENKTDKSLTRSIENNTAKTETLVSDNEKVEENSLKRKKSQTDENEIICSSKKRLNFDQDTGHKVTNKCCGLRVPEIRLVKSNYNGQSSKEVNQEVTIDKVQLIVKEKKKISYISQDVFPLLISLCLQKCPEHDKTDMNKIIDKLKRRYENLDPIYARSEDFVMFLNEKREAIINNNKKIYVHIEEVMNEMKKNTKKKSQALQNNEIYDAIPSTSYAINNIVNNRIESNNDVDEENEENASPKVRRKIKEVLRAMNKCEAIIKRLEEEEVDFNEDNDSNYIKVERYKQRMVELYNKLCELTGDNTDAGRVYLRPKHLNLTRIVAVDQAITNFINAKITRRNQMKRAGALTDYLIFPDYRDILECVNRCNEKKNLRLDQKRREQIAEKAFKELGEYLQRIRRNDYWDTFSIHLENTEDPAIKDKNLAKKLADNRSEGEKRLAAVFEKYAKKQEEIKEQNNEETSSEEEDEDEEEEEENIINDDDENLPVTSEKDSEEDIHLETVKEARLPVEKIKPNINTVNEYYAVDKVLSNKSIADTVVKCNKTVKIKVLKESDTAVSKNENKTINEKIQEPCCSNTILKNVENVERDTKMQEDSSTGFTPNCTKDLAEVEINEVSKAITDPATKKVTKEADTITGVTTRELIIGDAAKLIRGITITKNTAENAVIMDETRIITENVMDGTIDMQNDEQAKEEKKPVLRLRSFAKPPMTWEDSQHKLDKIAQENAPKETDQIKEIVDLTNEGPAKPPPVIAKKCTIQLGEKVLPIVKHQTVVIPTHKNIISVQNITNNYLKVNTRTGQIIAPVRDIRGSTIIRLPSIQSTSRQSQNANVIARNEVPLKGNETILRIIPKKSIIISQKSAVQSISKQTDTSSPTTKSK